jgi:hypothetical protein
MWAVYGDLVDGKMMYFGGSATRDPVCSWCFVGRWGACADLGITPSWTKPIITDPGLGGPQFMLKFVDPGGCTWWHQQLPYVIVHLTPVRERSLNFLISLDQAFTSGSIGRSRML